MVRRALFWVVVLGVLPWGVGCASVIRGSNQKIPVTSKPDGAKVVVYNRETGEKVYEDNTPCELNLRRGHGYFKSNEYRVVVTKAGYPTKTTYLQSNVNGWYIGGNAVIGGLVGWVCIDPLTGGMYHLNPDALTVDLVRAKMLETPVAATPAPALPARTSPPQRPAAKAAAGRGASASAGGQ